jgi:hypothetical protein
MISRCKQKNHLSRGVVIEEGLLCQCRSENASAGQNKNTSAMLARRQAFADDATGTRAGVRKPQQNQTHALQYNHQTDKICLSRVARTNYLELQVHISVVALTPSIPMIGGLTVHCASAKATLLQCHQAG